MPALDTVAAGWAVMEFVLIEAESTAIFEPSCPFEHLRYSGELSEAFFNRSGDALFISPVPLSLVPPPNFYGHLAIFCREGSKLQVYETWRLAASELILRLRQNKRAVWLSTSASGPSWVHFRLDESRSTTSIHRIHGVQINQVGAAGQRQVCSLGQAAKNSLPNLIDTMHQTIGLEG